MARGTDASSRPRPAGRGLAAVTVVVTRSWRARWRTLAVVALMAGLTGGLVFTALAGARRSASSLDRFHDAAQTLDIFLSGDLTTPEPPELRELLDGPLVESYNDLAFLFVDIESVGFVFGPTSRRGLEVEQGVLVEGRRADPDQPDEVVLNAAASESLGLGVGDTLAGGSFSGAQAAGYLGGDEEPTELLGPALRLRVVGIVRNGFDLAFRPDNTLDSVITFTTPAFMETYGDQIGVGSASHFVRLADTPDAVDEFTDAIADIYGVEHLPSINVGQGEATLSESISVVTGALAVMALVILVAGMVWIAAAVVRHQRLAVAEAEVLGALGLTRNQKWTLLFGTVLPGLVAGLALAPVIAIALSPLLPVGVARRIEPDPGLHADLVALLVGSLALAIALTLIGVIAAVRLVDQARRVAADRRVPGMADRVARGLRPAPGTGVRFATHEPRRATPVRPALLGALVGVVGLVAVAVVWASLHRLTETPERWGTTWDLALGDAVDREAAVIDRRLEELLDNDDIEAAAVLLYDEQVTVNGVEAISMTLEPLKGAIGPTVVEGREPRAADEIALARDTINAVDVPLGTTVAVGSRSNVTEDYRVVGVIAFPTIGEPTAVATGAVLTSTGGDRLRLGDSSASDDVGVRYLVVRWAPGVDPSAALERLGDVVTFANPPTAPPEVNGLRDVNRIPLVTAAALVLLGVIATSHGLIVTVRSRRLDLGVLTALGFTSGQRRHVIVAQATTVALIALLIGIPLGAIVGRLFWLAIARSLGVATDASFPPLVIAASATLIVVVLNLIAVLPAANRGTSAGGRRPARRVGRPTIRRPINPCGRCVSGRTGSYWGATTNDCAREPHGDAGP